MVSSSLFLDGGDAEHEVEVGSLIAVLLFVLVKLGLSAGDGELVDVLFEVFELILPHLPRHLRALILHLLLLSHRLLLLDGVLQAEGGGLGRLELGRGGNEVRPTEEHHLLEGLEIDEAQQKVHDLLINFVLALLNHLQEKLHIETIDLLCQFLFNYLSVKHKFIPELYKIL